ncbi:MAG: tRNA (adenosine(37)-N6)-threonylcarbamoyltransferase complex dimerization subunit type 1 TsaB [Bacteroidales bacterium]|nr:tRNA (adenosine(37)-N6)-threonylcarbamoyltransferase complex dimerization subunit type 1 TsaB [Bacteroidales bacterium]
MENTILLIETATESCSVALAKDREIIAEKYINEPKAHATLLARYIKDILEENNIRITDCSAVAVSEGPGSYTGLRVGVSCAKGLCYGAQKPLIGVSTLAAIAQCALDNKEIAESIGELQQSTFQTAGKRLPLLIVPMIDARRMEVYTAIFNEAGMQLTPTEAKILDETSFAEELDSSIVLFTGNGSEKFKPLVNHPHALFAEQLPHATGMRVIARDMYNKKEFKDCAYFEPFYLKEFVAGKPKKLL